MFRSLPHTQHYRGPNMPTPKECPRLCIRCVLNSDHGANYKGHRGYRPGERGTTDHPAVFDRQVASLPPKQEAKPVGPTEPTLHGLAYIKAFMVCDNDEDGTVHKPATINMFMCGDIWKVCLYDRHQGRSAWSEGPTWRDALVTLNANIENRTVIWKQSFKRTE